MQCEGSDSEGIWGWFGLLYLVVSISSFSDISQKSAFASPVFHLLILNWNKFSLRQHVNIFKESSWGICQRTDCGYGGTQGNEESWVNVSVTFIEQIFVKCCMQRVHWVILSHSTHQQSAGRVLPAGGTGGEQPWEHAHTYTHTCTAAVNGNILKTVDLQKIELKKGFLTYLKLQLQFLPLKRNTNDVLTPLEFINSVFYFVKKNIIQW